jgi:ATP-dependent Clp protease, protease subunit
MRSRTLRGLIGLSLCGLVMSGQSSEPKTAVIRFYAQVDENTVAKLLATVDAKIKEGTKRIILLISSPGGSTFAGLTAYHYLKGVPAEIITHNFGSVDSIASVMYCAGSKRYSVPEGRFILHGVSLTVGGAMSLEQDVLEERQRMMQQEARAIAAVIAETTGKPLVDIQAAMTKRTVLEADEARKWGLVQEIRSKLYEEGADLVPILSPDTIRSPNHSIAIVRSPDVVLSTNSLTFITTPLDFSTRQEENPFTLPKTPPPPSPH